MKRIFGITLIFSAACSASGTIIVAPNGQAAAVIECRHASQCWKTAGEFCPAGYTIVDGLDEKGFRAVSNQSFSSAGTTFHRTMMIACKDGSAPKKPKTIEQTSSGSDTSSDPEVP